MSAAHDVAAELRERFETLATDLVGSGPTSRSRHELRFYPRGGLAVDLRKGVFCDHAAGVGGDALDLVRHLRGGTTVDALAWARSWLGHTPGQPRPPAPAPRPAPSPEVVEYERRLREHSAARVWLASVDAQGSDVERYLAGRGLALPPDHYEVIRFHPSCPRGPEGTWPAMVCLMRDAATGEPCGVHRTFLSLDGASKAGDGKAKMMLGRAGVIHLSHTDDVTLGLGLTEGIETALSLMQVAGWAPVWACGSAGAIASFPVLGGVEHLTVFADCDDAGAGIKAARTCARRWVEAGREAAIELPPTGEDWHDTLRQVAA